MTDVLWGAINEINAAAELPSEHVRVLEDSNFESIEIPALMRLVGSIAQGVSEQVAFMMGEGSLDVGKVRLVAEVFGLDSEQAMSSYRQEAKAYISQYIDTNLIGFLEAFLNKFLRARALSARSTDCFDESSDPGFLTLRCVVKSFEDAHPELIEHDDESIRDLVGTSVIQVLVNNGGVLAAAEA